MFTIIFCSIFLSFLLVCSETYRKHLLFSNNFRTKKKHISLFINLFIIIIINRQVFIEFLNMLLRHRLIRFYRTFGNLVNLRVDTIKDKLLHNRIAHIKCQVSNQCFHCIRGNRGFFTASIPFFPFTNKKLMMKSDFFRYFTKSFLPYESNLIKRHRRFLHLREIQEKSLRNHRFQHSITHKFQSFIMIICHFKICRIRLMHKTAT